ncbi:MAG: LytTR family DNA-binding domain-containing protein [Clostridiales bacterium]|nr:LytTR family DNA-binding domain-containing protein [Clostridiales bacterium]MDY3746445.1 LytTR family DNA-binding domain-containing protein [Lachnospiraceae bacterium]
MIKIAITDDDIDDLCSVYAVTQKFFTDAQVACEIDKFLTPEALINKICENVYFDIYLLDIHMKGIVGCQIAQRLQEKFENPLIIFVTHYREYAVKGYEYNIYRYILKSELTKKLPEALKKCVEKIERQRVHKDYLEVSGINHFELIKFSDIFYITKEKKYVIIVCDAGRREIRTTLKEMSKKLDGELFVFCDKSYIVNLMHIKSVKERMLYLDNGERIPVSVPRLKEVLDRFKTFRQKRNAKNS